ncbi:MAG: carboxylesterase family protein [Parvibaculum sp.]|uniref:carboxylesterase/lipase family protein n=1 Tax=Parvibaculum sp. TaxID=2024848 RepID=UPI0025CDC4C7|nr:carboxylesterase family protein [Parvibaculum sp.]MCE9651117.1 carboxylesterase family protein [Parvibaculum sp.]
MRLFAIVAAAAALGVALVASAMTWGGDRILPPDSKIVSVETGELQGVRGDGLTAFKGIPYAAAPVGALRWRAPQPAAHWQGVRPANAYGDDCMQNRFIFDSAPSSQSMSEDCLFLNVWTPSPDAGKRPVMVWIHGGALITGSGSAPVFNGSAFARKGVVLVTINYRVGRFGFFAHPALTHENPQGPLGNYGLMDQIAALKWVQANIAAFGGDSANVTIFGESAGGSSVNNLMTSPASAGLFAKAIVESGGGRERTPWIHDGHPEAGPSGEAAGMNFVKSLDVKADDATALRAIPAKDVLGGLQFWTDDPKTWTGAMVDGTILPKPAMATFAEGGQHKVPYIIGANSLEMGIPLARSFLEKGVKKKLAQMGDKGRELLGLYGVRPRAGGKDGGEMKFGKAGAEIASDAAFVEPARSFASFAAKAGQPAFLYQFGYVAEEKRGDLDGALHASEVPYVFNTLALVPRDDYSKADEAVAEKMQNYWVNFAKTGNPNGEGLTPWPAYSPSDDVLLSFSDKGEAAVRNFNRARLDFLAANAKPYGAADK